MTLVIGIADLALLIILCIAAWPMMWLAEGDEPTRDLRTVRGIYGYRRNIR